MKLFDFLPGWKTYIVAFGMFAKAIGDGFIVGDISLIDWNLMLEALAIMGLRKGIN